MLDATAERFRADSKLAGTLLENFVALELLKQASWSGTRPSLWHFRDHRGYEVDFVLESPRRGKIVGIEVKLTQSLDTADAKGLRVLADAAGGAFHRGIILYAGDEALPFGRNIWALPVSALWQLGVARS
jgi:predicted AAA+ superfamily ATPase